MKPEEIMVGDWIMFPNSIEKVQEVSFVEGKGYCASFAASATLFPISTDLLKPIPITQEILEKNGFKKNDAGYKWFKADDKSYYFGFDSIYYDLEDNFLNITKEFSQDMSQSQVKGKYKYVHELQHALRLCKIEKEIEL